MEAARFPWPALGVLLVRDGLVSTEALQRVLTLQGDDRGRRVSSRRLGEALVENGLVTSAQVARLVAEQHELPFIDLESPDAIVPVSSRVSEILARHHTALPIRTFPDGSLLVAISDPTKQACFDDIRREAGVPVRFAVGAPEAIVAAIDDAATRGLFLADAAADVGDAEDGRPEEADEPTELGGNALNAEQHSWPVFGSLLLRDELVSESELEASLAQQRLSSTRRLGEILISRGALTDDQVARVLAEQHELPFVDLRSRPPDVAAGKRLPTELARRHLALPISSLPDGSLLVAVADPASALLNEELRAALESPLQFAVATPDAIDEAIDLVTGRVHAVPDPEPEDTVTPEGSATQHGGVSLWHSVPPLLLVEDGNDDHGELEAEADEAEQPAAEIVRDLDADVEPMLDVVEAEAVGTTEEEATEVVVDAEADVVLEADMEVEVDAESDVEAEADDWFGELETEPEGKPIVDLVDDFEAEPEPVHDVVEGEEVAAADVTFRSEIASDLETLPHAHAEAEVERVADLETALDRALDAMEPEAVVELDSEPDAEVAVEDVTEAEVEAEIALENEIEYEVEAGVDVEAEAEVDTWPEAEVAFEDMTEADAEAEPEIEPEVDATPEVIEEVELEAEPAFALFDPLESVVALDASTEGAELEAESEAEPVVNRDDEESELDESVEPAAEPVRATEPSLVEVLQNALALRASAVHFTPALNGIVVRARVSGTLDDIEIVARDAEKDLAELVSRGRVSVQAGEHSVELRAVALPTVLGQRVTFHVVGNGRADGHLEARLQETAAAAIADALERPGLLVVGGPRRSGRTTTLYTALDDLAFTGAVLTIEDPVERKVPGVDQTEVDPRAGLTYGTGLHAILQSDPDVVAVGELLDPDASRLAVRAALDGHRVLSTVEAEGVAGSVRRLLDLGVQPHALAQALGGVVSQRLLRRFCLDCREPYYASAEELVALGLGVEEGGRRLLGRGRGCASCGGTGHRGVVAVFEVLPLDEDVRAAIAAGGSAAEIERAAVEAGMQTLREGAVQLCLEGATTAVEAVRVPTHADR